MSKAERKVLDAANRICGPVKRPRRFWVCEGCGYTTISSQRPDCRDCDGTMKADRIL